MDWLDKLIKEVMDYLKLVVLVERALEGKVLLDEVRKELEKRYGKDVAKDVTFCIEEHLTSSEIDSKWLCRTRCLLAYLIIEHIIKKFGLIAEVLLKDIIHFGIVLERCYNICS